MCGVQTAEGGYNLYLCCCARVSMLSWLVMVLLRYYSDGFISPIYILNILGGWMGLLFVLVIFFLSFSGHMFSGSVVWKKVIQASTSFWDCCVLLYVLASAPPTCSASRLCLSKFPLWNQFDVKVQFAYFTFQIFNPQNLLQVSRHRRELDLKPLVCSWSALMKLKWNGCKDNKDFNDICWIWLCL